MFIYNSEASRDDKNYSEVVDRLERRKCQLLVNGYVISEYVNASMRIYFKEAIKNGSLPEDARFKADYQKTTEYKDKFNFVIDSVQNDILSRFHLINTDSIWIERSLTHSKKMKDFNDRVIVQTAVDQKAKILTDDADFLDCQENITLLSQNRKILKCSDELTY